MKGRLVYYNVSVFSQEYNRIVDYCLVLFIDKTIFGFAKSIKLNDDYKKGATTGTSKKAFVEGR